MKKIDRTKPRKGRANRAAPEISKIVAGVRLASMLTQKQAAEEIGISIVTLGRLESGDLRLSARNLEKILNFFDLTISAASRKESAETSAQSGNKSADNYPKW